MSAFLNNPVFICGHRKSGTTMLCSLFDDHDDILVYPSDSSFFYKIFPPCLNLKKIDSVNLVIKNCIRETLGSEMKNIGKNDLFDIPRIRLLNTNYLMLMAQIKLHTGTPCDRYCICRHFDNEDFIRYYHQVT